MKYHILQGNFFAGQVENNKAKILTWIKEILESDQGQKKPSLEEPRVIITPELAISGYPALDLYNDPDFLNQCQKALHEIVCFTQNNSRDLFIIGCPSQLINGKCYNVAYHICNGQILSYTCKKLLPEYDIFWDNRYFHSGYKDPNQTNVIEFHTKKIGILICEDQWDDNYDNHPYKEIMKEDVQTVISLNASPFYVGKVSQRVNVITGLINSCIRKPRTYIYVNTVGGNDGYDGEQVFDGNSMIFTIGNKVNLFKIGHSFRNDTTLNYSDILEYKENAVDILDIEEKDIFEALVLGIQNYFGRCHISKAIVGLSGGIDSAVVACLLVKALTNDNVYGFAMPSACSSDGSLVDAHILAKNLGIACEDIPIRYIFDEMRKQMAYCSVYAQMGDRNPVAEENLQARIRGNILMAISNKIGSSIVISTGNKTELALGYCTSHGDMAGGLSPIGDLNKIRVYNLARYINANWPNSIPEDSITKPPSAELAPGQTDAKGLGADYDLLSPIVDDIVENHLSFDELFQKYQRGYNGHPNILMNVIRDTIKRIYRNEFKRRLAAPCIKVTSKSFGSGRKIPISYMPEN